MDRALQARLIGGFSAVRESVGRPYGAQMVWIPGTQENDAAPIGGPCQHAGGRCGSAMPDAILKLLMQFSSAGMVLSRLHEE